MDIFDRFPYEFVYKDTNGRTRKMVRQEVPAGVISWDIPYAAYDPITFTSNPNGEVDPDIKDPSFNPKFNQIDGPIDRRSFEGPYRVHQKVPLNVRGRTGLFGRGTLPRYGPNHSTDSIVTKWKRHPDAGILVHDEVSQRPILQFVAAFRKDTNEWALPGGSVDPDPDFIKAFASGFRSKEKLSQFFQNGKEIYKGYVDDPRNTDNAWLETTVYLYHDEYGNLAHQFGNEVLQWMDIDENIQMYATHKKFLMLAAKRLGAHWRKVKSQ